MARNKKMQKRKASRGPSVSAAFKRLARDGQDSPTSHLKKAQGAIKKELSMRTPKRRRS